MACWHEVIAQKRDLVTFFFIDIKLVPRVFFTPKLASHAREMAWERVGTGCQTHSRPQRPTFFLAGGAFLSREGSAG